MKIEPRRVLDAGSGAGAALAGLRRRYPASEIIALDDVKAELTALINGPARAGVLRKIGAMLGVAPGSPLALAANLGQLPFAEASMGLVWSNLALQRAADRPTPARPCTNWAGCWNLAGC
ncbi:MAG: methyltransferase domain-containing protein [Rhodospirillales bacterium]